MLPDIPNQRISSEHEIEECLAIQPSDQTGNGIFIANFKLKPNKVDEANKEENLDAKISTMNILDLEKPLHSVTKRKRKLPAQRKKGEKLKIHLPKQLKQSVERLSVPRASIQESKSIPQTPKKSSSAVSLQGIQQDTTDDENYDIPKAIPIGDDEDAPPHLTADIGVFGTSLKRFYNPRSQAIKLIDNTKLLQPQPSRWIYPVRLINQGT